jgi:hypothetical protein
MCSYGMETYHTITAYITVFQIELLGSKHVEDIKNSKLKYTFRKCAFYWLISYNYITIHCAKNVPST